MPELPNRDDLEAIFIKKFGTVARRHMHEFRELLGNPPDLDNVPPEFWDRMKRETDESIVAILLLLWGSSASLHGWDGADAQFTGFGWAVERARDFANQWVDSTRSLIERAIERKRENVAVERERTKPQKQGQSNEMETSQSGIAVVESDEMDVGYGDSDLPAGSTVAPNRRQPVERSDVEQPGEIPETLTDEEWRDLLDKLFGPKRIARNAEDEVTRARHEGGEAAIDATVGLSANDLWKCDWKYDHVCEVCEPLDEKPRSVWELAFPDGPPTPHPGCRCWIQYAKVPG